MAPWNISNTSFAWKLIFSETDPSQTLTQTTTHSSSYATNFGLDFQKIGLKFGGSAQVNYSQTFTIQTSVGSDQLGEAIAFFSDPVLTDILSVYQGGVFRVYPISVGGYLDIALVPQPKY